MIKSQRRVHVKIENVWRPDASSNALTKVKTNSSGREFIGWVQCPVAALAPVERKHQWADITWVWICLKSLGLQSDMKALPREKNEWVVSCQNGFFFPLTIISFSLTSGWQKIKCASVVYLWLRSGNFSKRKPPNQRCTIRTHPTPLLSPASSLSYFLTTSSHRLFDLSLAVPCAISILFSLHLCTACVGRGCKSKKTQMEGKDNLVARLRLPFYPIFRTPCQSLCC